MFPKTGLFCLISLFSLLASAPAAAAPPAAQSESPAYRIESDDVLDITVLGEGELSRSLTVLPDGFVSYPYLGRVRVDGLTVLEMTERIRKALTSQILRPEVTVSIARRADHTVSVLGAVKTPGRSVIQSGWRVLDVLAASGGLSVDRPEWVTMTLVSGGKTRQIDLPGLLSSGNPSANPTVSPGDILLVAEREASETQVQILGAVIKQGAYPAPADGSPVSGVALAGGASPDAALSRAVIRRGGQSIPVDLRPLLTENAASAPSAGNAVRLEAGDTLFIPQNTRRFAVLGAVSRPGALAYPEDGALGVLEALSLAGGQTPTADLKNVLLLRSDQVTKEGGAAGKAIPVNLWEEMRRRRDGRPGAKGAASVADIVLAPGDVLFVPDKGAGHRSDMLSALPVLGLFLR